MKKNLKNLTLTPENEWCAKIDWEQGEEKSLSSFVDATMKYIIENFPQIEAGILFIFDDATVVYYEKDSWYYANLTHLRKNQKQFYSLYMHYSELHTKAKNMMQKRGR